MYTKEDKKIYDKIVKQLNENAKKKKCKIGAPKPNTDKQVDCK